MNEKSNIIAVIDDTPANLKLLSELLSANGFRVLAFPRGVQAIESFKKIQPDLILLDIRMPDMDGFQVCKKLKEDPTLAEIPVIFISALDDVEDKVKAFTSGGVDYITKPFRFEEVLARVSTHLRLRQLQLEVEEHNLHLERLVHEKMKEICDAQIAIIIALARLAESRDDDTGKHVFRTQIFSRKLAEYLYVQTDKRKEMKGGFVEQIYYAAALHDIGKVGILDAILLKPGKLTPEEFEIMKTHTVIGGRTLKTAYERYPQNQLLRMGLEIALSHHEKWIGNGYPEGLKGESIPLSARIMSVADVYDALRSVRPYKPAYIHEEACRILQEAKGTQFDPDIIEVFLDHQEDFDLTYREYQN